MMTFLTRATPLIYSEQHSSGVGDTVGGGLKQIFLEKKASMVTSAETQRGACPLLVEGYKAGPTV